MRVKNLGRSIYRETWQAMQDFTNARDQDTADELWITEHAAVFTQGLNGKPEHLLEPGDIPVVQIDRGGQVTYHGPGQLVLYCLLDIMRLGLGVKALVAVIEQSVIDLLRDYGIDARTRTGAPGVYVGDAKIAALGLRIRKGCCYHGLSLNVDVELEPFARINPCGYQGLAVTRLLDFGIEDDVDAVGEKLASKLIGHLSEKKSGSAGR
jgi:lipoyl(octanoyl) transferase